MDIEVLRLFLDVHKSGNITNAANNHYITQSALSRRLFMLEKELGIQLFQRGKGKSQVIITPEGKAFSEIAERILTLYEQATQLKRGAHRQFLTVASINSVQDYLLPKLIFQLEQECPGLCISLEDHKSHEIFTLLKDRKVDVGITSFPAPYPELCSELLYEEPYFVIRKPRIGDTGPGETLHPSQLKAEYEVYKSFSDEFQEWHNQWWRPFSSRIRVNTTPTAEQYLSSPENWIIVPAAIAKAMEEKGFRSYPLWVQPPRHQVFLICNKQDQSHATELFLPRVRAYFRALSNV